MLEAPNTDTVKGLRDRVILVVLLYHGLQERRGIKHLRVHGKGSKIRLLHLHPVAAEHISAARSHYHC
ncbi:Phage integrase family site specific recombinase [Pseudomonas amygdali pv. myricae]|uniref:Phage integrase family site specific recombinase n=1 Tax=Pseudomonas amygdali pv. ulmi TaxID=251720 RepID=A0A3M4TC48_PSEA0|nr:Phage integrase family site specific recombinase [Pseudomonas syringae pv. cunninghamiae]KPX92629.1 Phage integrase family site specific recombinase [Pseudomonas amygdali pv. myricae]RMR24787.1 Phage integrase family site specific recombinase [Pseudomonas amygdali pv. ulmi]